MNLVQSMDALQAVVNKINDGQKYAAMTVDHVLQGRLFSALVSVENARSADPDSWDALYEEVLRDKPAADLIVELYAHGLGEAAKTMTAARHAADAVYFAREGDFNTAVECAELAVQTAPIWRPFLAAIRQDVTAVVN